MHYWLFTLKAKASHASRHRQRAWPLRQSRSRRPQGRSRRFISPPSASMFSLAGSFTVSSKFLCSAFLWDIDIYIYTFLPIRYGRLYFSRYLFRRYFSILLRHILGYRVIDKPRSVAVFAMLPFLPAEARHYGYAYPHKISSRISRTLAITKRLSFRVTTEIKCVSPRTPRRHLKCSPPSPAILGHAVRWLRMHLPPPVKCSFRAAGNTHMQPAEYGVGKLTYFVNTTP